MNQAIVTNPHWIGNSPAWDIILTDGTTHKDITKSEITQAMCMLYDMGKVNLYDTYIDIVRQFHIDGYNRLHTTRE